MAKEYTKTITTKQYFKMNDYCRSLKNGNKICFDQKGGSVYTDWVEVKITGPESMSKEIDRLVFLFKE